MVSSHHHPSAALRVPCSFQCPIMHEIMEDPVTTIDGQTCERAGIEGWFARGRRTSPLTNAPLGTTALVPNIALRNAIQEFLEQHEIFCREHQVSRDEMVALRVALDLTEEALSNMKRRGKQGKEGLIKW